MLTVTERAVDALQQLRAAQNPPEDHGVKLVPDSTGNVGMVIAAPAEGDEVVREGETPVLIVDGRIAPHLDGAVFDVQAESGQDRPHFTLRPREEG